MDWKVGDWVVFEMKVGQIKEIRNGGCASFSDGNCETSGRISERFRPLTLRNKVIADTFGTYYRRLYDIDGEAGFNYPDIVMYFSQLALDAIDNEGSKEPFDKANEFVKEARQYTPVIHGVALFWRKIKFAR